MFLRIPTNRIHHTIIPIQVIAFLQAIRPRGPLVQRKALLIKSWFQNLILWRPRYCCSHQSLDNTTLAPGLNLMFFTLCLITQLAFQKHELFSHRSEQKDSCDNNSKISNYNKNNLWIIFTNARPFLYLLYSYNSSTITPHHFFHLCQISHKNKNA